MIADQDLDLVTCEEGHEHHTRTGTGKTCGGNDELLLGELQGRGDTRTVEPGCPLESGTTVAGERAQEGSVSADPDVQGVRHCNKDKGATPDDETVSSPISM